jgi:ABC-type antimicrobial peptide transport system permease subunit
MEGVTTGATGSDGGGVYLPMAQHPRTDVTVLMRSELDPGLIAGQIRKVIAEIDPEQALGRVATLKTALEEELLPYEVTSVVFRIFGISAVFLAGMGIYGMMTFSVNRRIREFGIRLALGAQRRHILEIVMRQSGVAIVIGMACGFFLSHCLARILVGVFPVVRYPSLALYSGIFAVLMGIAVVAIGMPARRACRVSPVSALRHH